MRRLPVWFRAQHTIPSPYILGNIKSPVEGMDNLAVADMLGWPSDFRAWGRLVDWIIGEAAAIPVRLIPKLLEVFGVWQNAFADRKNGRSKAILQVADAWLVRFEKGELHDKSDGDEEKARTLSRDESSRLGNSLRSILLRSARSYPDFAKTLFNGTIADEDRRRAVYARLIAFSPVMAQVDPDLLADLAGAQLLEELPEDKLMRERKEREEHYKYLEELRAIPKEKRTRSQNLALQSFFPIGNDRYDLDDIGIERHNDFYFPTSPLHEPFKSLFANKPDVALRLVRNLANHATTGWRQIHSINRKTMGTPVPVSVALPWGVQQFWGDWHVYSWGMGQLAPQPLECAFLALNYWAFKEIEGGRSAMVRNVGWSSYVIGKFLDLCERTGRAYPISEFGPQANAALAAISNAEEGWAGTMLPARMAGVVQRQADWNFSPKAFGCAGAIEGFGRFD